MIDDCSEILESFAEILGMDGFSVIKANGGEQWVELFKSCRKGIELVGSEVGLALNSGDSAIHEIRRIDKNMPVLFITGYDAREVSRQIGVFENYYLLHKPFPPKYLGENIRAIIA